MVNQWTCPQCGQTNPAEMRFCPHCGAANPAEAPPTGQAASTNRRGLWTAAIGLWVVGLAVLAVGGGIWLARRGQPAQAEPDVAAAIPSPETPTPALPTASPTATTPPTATPPPATPTVMPTEPPDPTATPSRAGAGDTLSFDTATPTPTTTPTVTSTPTPRPVAVLPSPTPAPIVDCPPGVQITSPAPGAVFNQRNNFIVGTADIVQFHHWRIEYSTSPGGGGWNYLLERDYPVQNDKLVMIDAKTIPRGPYGLRLTVVDATGNYPEPCEVWFVNGY